MKAIILAAGQGTRLKKYTENLPKGMLEFMGQTLIERQIATYRKAGIDEIIVVKGFAKEKITYENIKYYINEDFATTNMVYSLLTAKEEFDDEIIVSYSDIIFERNMLLKLMNDTQHFSFMVDDKWKEYWKLRYGKIEFDTESLSINSLNEVTSIGLENPNIDLIDSRYVGLLKFSSKALKIILDVYQKDFDEYKDKPWKQSGKNILNAYMTDLIQALIEKGHKVYAERYHHGWLEFDTNEDYEKALQWSKEGRLKQLIDLD